MLFTIHHVAGSGGSIVSQVISAATNSILISEINPFASIRNKNIEPFYDPTSILWHLTYNSKEISANNKLKYFFFQLGISINHAQEFSKNLVIRDHTHSTFNFLGNDIVLNNEKIDSLFLDPLKLFYKVNSSEINFPKAKPILSIRHPLDNYISARKRRWLGAYCGLNLNIENYCKSLIKLQKHMKMKENAVVIRYEDLCLGMEKVLASVFKDLEVEYKIPTLVDINKNKVTGKSGRKSVDISLRDRMISEVDKDLIDEINQSLSYNEYCNMNNYNINYKEYPII